MRKLAAFLLLVCLLSCGKKKGLPAGILEPSKMELVFWDYSRADVFTRDYIKKDSALNDTLKNLELQKKVFDFYKISREDFYRSYAYYTNHPELMNTMIDSILAKQNRYKLDNQLQINLKRSKSNGSTFKVE